MVIPIYLARFLCSVAVQPSNVNGKLASKFLLESGPMGSYHAARGWGLLVAAMLLEAAAYWWQPEAHGSMMVGSGNQVPWRSTFLCSTSFYPLLLAELLSVRSTHLPVLERSRNTD